MERILECCCGVDAHKDMIEAINTDQPIHKQPLQRNSKCK